MSTHTKTTTRTTHVLALPIPIQGHVLPLLETMQWLGPHGIKVTFVNTEVSHSKVLSGKHNIGDHIDLVSIPDGMEPWEDRSDSVKWHIAMNQVMPGKLEELILKINGSSFPAANRNNNKITCVIADSCFPWSVGLAKKLGLRCVLFLVTSASQMAFMLKIPKLLQDGIIDENGTPQKMELVQLSPNMTAINPSHFLWVNYPDPLRNQLAFKFFSSSIKDFESADRIICNSCYELEPAVFDSYPNITPVGPLLAKNRQGDSTGYFWKEDLACMEWLNEQQSNSVIYIAFGSTTVFNKTQFQELAFGIEMSNKPFLWVVRPNMIIDKSNGDTFTKRFKERVRSRGRIIDWAPQQRVLSHPSIACFFSHCGWNSTVEGLGNGVPFLCWPYFFTDQPLHQSYICDVWKVGLGLHRDNSGIIRKEEVLKKVELLLGDGSYKKKAMKLKDVIARSVSQGGLSNKNLNNFIDWLKKA